MVSLLLSTIVSLNTSASFESCRTDTDAPHNRDVVHCAIIGLQPLGCLRVCLRVTRPCGVLYTAWPEAQSVLSISLTSEPLELQREAFTVACSLRSAPSAPLGTDALPRRSELEVSTNGNARIANMLRENG